VVPDDRDGALDPRGTHFGGLAQFIAALFSLRKGDTFAATAFGSYTAAGMVIDGTFGRAIIPLGTPAPSRG
jgi:succinate-acetate transporter protein